MVRLFIFMTLLAQTIVASDRRKCYRIVIFLADWLKILVDKRGFMDDFGTSWIDGLANFLDNLRTNRKTLKLVES